MSERLEQKDMENKERVTYTLRTATEADLEFLFEVSTKAMEPVNKALNPAKEFNSKEEFKKHKEKFVPDKIQVISYEGEDVGRLRVVRSLDSIYVGGIQILPEFQGKRIGRTIFIDLIEESKASLLPITLEVHDVNERAVRFYTDLGFEKVEQKENKTLMKYTPTTFRKIN